MKILHGEDVDILKKEASMMMGLGSEHIGRTKTRCTSNRSWIFPTDWNLWELIKGKLSTLQQKAEICLGIVSALRDIHSRRIVHGVVKTQNMIVSLNSSESNKCDEIPVTGFVELAPELHYDENAYI